MPLVRLHLADLVLPGLELLLELLPRPRISVDVVQAGLHHFDDLVRMELRRVGVGVDALAKLDWCVLEGVHGAIVRWQDSARSLR